jgi:RHS repeat-associated protein
MRSLLLVAVFPAMAAAQSTTQVVEYYTTDALGSVRAVTKQVNGQWQVTRHDFMPFGEEVAPQNPPQDKRLFTGKERDSETGVDYFEARYLRSGVGRFTTIDPVYTWKENLVDPQRWNRYAYVRNNPLKFVDPDGREITVSPEVQALYGKARQSQSVRDYLKPYEGKNAPNLTISVGSIKDKNELGEAKVSYDTRWDSNALEEKNTVKNATIVIDSSLINAEDDLSNPKGPTATMCEEIGHVGASAKDPNKVANQAAAEARNHTEYEDKQTEKDAKAFSVKACQEIKDKIKK